MNTELILKRVFDEIQKAETKHPKWPTDLIHAGAIVSEESGELIRACVQYTYESGPIDEVEKEAIQTIATCFRLLKNNIQWQE